MMRMSLQDLIAGLREGRLSAETARRWLEQEASEPRAVRAGSFAAEFGPGDIRAHSNRHAADVAHSAIDKAFRQADAQDEYSGLFPPHSPLGAPIEDEGDETGMGHYAPGRKSRVQRASASTPLSDDELYHALYGEWPDD